MTGLRRDVEQRSAVLLVWLSTLPRWLLPVAAAALLAGVVFAPTALALFCLLVLLAALGWLSFLSWPATDGRGRALRLMTLALLVLLGVQSLAN